MVAVTRRQRARGKGQEVESEPTFTVGQQVRIKNHPLPDWIGKTGTIVQIERGKGKPEAQVALATGVKSWAVFAWLEAIAPPERKEAISPCEYGDYVRGQSLKDNAWIEGEVTAIGHKYIELDGERSKVILIETLEILRPTIPEPPEEQKTAFKVGDRVLIRQKGHPDLHGRISRFNSDGESVVFVNEFNAATTVSSQYLLPTEQASEAHKPEVVGTFKAGDRVKVVKVQPHQSEQWTGRFGKVEKVTKNRLHVRLEEGAFIGYTNFTLPFPHDYVELVTQAIAPHSSPIPHPSDPLSTLAAQINELHNQGQEAEATAIAAGKAALQLRKEEGDRLLEAKAQVKHGQWGQWLKAHCPDISERSCQLYMQLAEGWEDIAKNETVADLTLREAIALLPKRTKPATPTPTPSALEYTPLPAPRPVWFKVGERWTEGQAIAENGNGQIRIMWGENRESDVPAWRVEWSQPPALPTMVSPETKVGLAAAGLSICKPSITPAEFNRELGGDKPPAVSYTPTVSPPVTCQLCQHRTPIDGDKPDRYWCELGEFDDTLPNKYDWAKDGNEGSCKSFNASPHPLYDRALAFERQSQMEPETPTVRLKVKRSKGKGVEILSAIVQCNGITHYLQLEDLALEDF